MRRGKESCFCGVDGGKESCFRGWVSGTKRMEVRREMMTGVKRVKWRGTEGLLRKERGIKEAD